MRINARDLKRYGPRFQEHARREFGAQVSHKYRVSVRHARTYNGVVYASKAEMRRAVELDLLLKAGQIRSYRRQPLYQLGADFHYRADFEVMRHDGVHAEDVKGFETREFRRVKRLWRKYGPVNLVILKRARGWTAETIPAKSS